MADYTFTIKTPAELSGVEQAVARFEKLRGAAQANGKDFSELDRKIAAAKASIEAFNTAQTKLTQTTTKLADESARYQQALEKQSLAAREAADAEALAALKSEVAAKAQAKKQVLIEETIYAQSELANLTRTYTQAEVDALQKTGEATDAATTANDSNEVSARKLDKAYGALAAQGGPVGRTANLLRELAGSPITFALAAGSILVGIITQKYAAWREEVQRTRARLMEMEWGKLDGFRTALTNASQAQANLNEAMAAAGKVDDEVGEAYQRRVAVLDAEIERKKNLLKLNEELEVSNLKAKTEARLEAAEGIKSEKERTAAKKVIQSDAEKAEQQIRSRYRVAGGMMETTADAAKLQQLRAELAEREGRQTGLAGAAQSTRAAADKFAQSKPVLEAKTKLDDANAEMDRLRKEYREAGGDEELAALQGVAEMPGASESMPFSVLEYHKLKKLKAQVDAANLGVFGAQGRVDMDATRQQQLEADARTAQNAATTNNDAITGLRAKIGTGEAVNAVRARNPIDEAGFAAGSSGKLLLDASAGADALAGGGKPSGEQAAAIAEATRLFGLQGRSNKEVIAILSRINDTVETLTTALAVQAAKAAQNQADAKSRLKDAQNF